MCAQRGGQPLQKQGIGIALAGGNAVLRLRTAKFVASGKHTQHRLAVQRHLFKKLRQQGHMVRSKPCSRLCQQRALRHVRTGRKDIFPHCARGGNCHHWRSIL